MSLIIDGYIQDQVSAELYIQNLHHSLNREVKLFEDLLDDFDILTRCKTTISTYGISNQFRELVDRNKKLSKLTGVNVAVGTEHQISIALEGIIGDAWKAIMKFFSTIWEKIQEIFGVRDAAIHRQVNSIKIHIKKLENSDLDMNKIKTKEMNLIKLSELRKMTDYCEKLINMVRSLPEHVEKAKSFTLKNTGISDKELLKYLGIKSHSEKIVEQDSSELIKPEVMTLADAGVTDVDHIRDSNISSDGLGVQLNIQRINQKIRDLNEAIKHLAEKNETPASMKEEEKKLLHDAKIMVVFYSTVISVVSGRMSFIMGQLDMLARGLIACSKQ